VPAPVVESSLRVVARLAAAEGHVHGVPADSVAFHDVGALDSIADVVATCTGLNALGVSEVSAGPIALGSGRAHTAHGELPIPVPAVLHLVRGWRAFAGGTGELATPTGAAIVTALASACVDLPMMEVAAVGVGVGTRDVTGRPNVVRVVVAGSRVPSLPSAERRVAREFARARGIRHLEVCTDEEERPGYVANGGDRCYHCKSEPMLPSTTRAG
jgi:uncharacterized protein (DUF111 family)